MRLFFIALFLSAFSFADTSTELESDCTTACANETADWSAVADCFMRYRNKADSYLAVATCALNNNKDAAAEEYALKAAKESWEWTTFLRKIPGVSKVYRTGGLGEKYCLAYVASGGARHESTAKKYLRTSGQCMNAEDKETCAEDYFNNVVMRYQMRNSVSARTSSIPPGLALKGRITDMDGKPMKFAKITFICGTKTYTNMTDNNGEYIFPYSNKLRAADLCTQGKLYVKLQYQDPNNSSKIYFRVLWNNEPMWAMKKVTFSGEADLRQDFQITNPLPPGSEAYPSTADIFRYGVIYSHMSEAVEFYKDHLKANIDYKLPVDVIPCTTGKSTYYSPTTSTIFISHLHCSDTHPFRPKNREYHEFSHHVMFSMYGKWPQVPPGATPPEINHDGYINPTTGDSYTEGFAEFMALAISDYYHESSPEVYSSFGSMDVDWKAFDRLGRYEELAIAGVLWDLYDSSGDDKVDLTIQQIFNVMKDYRADFTEFYLEITKKFPGFKKDIDQIFLDHGFWKDSTQGNSFWEAGEPLRDLNRNNVFNPGEPFVDYAEENLLALPYFIHQENEEIGSAANYQRLQRKNTVTLPGHNIKVDNDHMLYRVAAEFPNEPELNFETITANEDRLVYVNVPPGEYDATVTVEPYGAQGNPLRIKSSEFEKGFIDANKRGYYAEHPFGISGTKPVIKTQDASEPPYWDKKDLVAKPEDYAYSFKDTSKEFIPDYANLLKIGKKSLDLPLRYILIGAIVLGALFLFRKRRR